MVAWRWHPFWCFSFFSFSFCVFQKGVIWSWMLHRGTSYFSQRCLCFFFSLNQISHHLGLSVSTVLTFYSPDCRWEELVISLSHHRGMMQRLINTCSVFNVWDVGTQMVFHIFICTSKIMVMLIERGKKGALLLAEKECCVQSCLCSSACQLSPPSYRLPFASQ